MPRKSLNELVAVVGTIFQEAMGAENVKIATSLAGRLSKEAKAASKKAKGPAEDMWHKAELHGAAIEAHREAKRSHDLLFNHHYGKYNSSKSEHHDQLVDAHEKAMNKHEKALHTLTDHPDFEKGYSDFQHDSGFKGAVIVRKKNARGAT